MTAKNNALKSSTVTMRSMPFWCVGNPLGDPFGEKVLPHQDSVDTARMLAIAKEKGLIEATSFHDDDLVNWDPQDLQDDMKKSSETAKKLREIKKILDDCGLKINTATCSLHGLKMFRRGGITNPDKKTRELAAKKVERSIRIGHMLGAKYFTYWVARDGFEVPVAVEWQNVYNWLAEGLNGAYDYIKQNKFSNYVGGTIEPKPNEPRGHMFLPTAGHAAGFIFGHLKDPDFWGVNPELLQHESMALMNGVLTVAYLVSIKKLFFIHLGSQIKAQFDNDFPPLIGPEGLKETVFMFWALGKMGWRGTVEYDCHMLRTEGDPDDPKKSRQQFIINCTRALEIILALAGRLHNFSINDFIKNGESAADIAAIAKMCDIKQ
jgi:xylose isomerase